MSNRCCSRFILFLVLAANASTLFAQAPAVQVQVYDYADMNPGSVHKVVALTQEILAGAGLSIQVIPCRPNPVASCESKSGTTRRLVIRVLPRGPKTMDSVLRPPLARSIAGPEGGMYASVFLSRIKDSPAEANVPWDIVLAYATAHEVGHLLLGADAHTARGVMKASWDREDYEAMYQRQLHFDDGQSRKLASLYGGSPRADVTSEPAIAQPR